MVDRSLSFHFRWTNSIFFKRDIWNWKSKPGGVLLMHFSQVVLAWVTLSITIVTLECLLHFVNPTITPIHSFRQGLILSPGTAPPHHFAPQTQWTLLQHHHLHCPERGHYPTTSPFHTDDVDTILLLSLVLPTILLPPSAVFSHQSTLSAFLSPIHSYTFSCVPANEARHSRVKQIIMSINTKSTFWRLLTFFWDPILRLNLSLVCSKLRF